MIVSNYAWSALAPLKFNLESLLGTKYAKTGLTTPILTWLVIFTVGNFNIMNAYNNAIGITTFADDNIQAFKYITPTITILPYDAYAALTSSSSSNSSSKTTSISL